MERFCKNICELYQKECLRTSSEADIVRIQNMSAKRGFSGCICSLDCMHWVWKNCPTAYPRQYKGKEKKPAIIILEGVADDELWI